MNSPKVFDEYTREEIDPHLAVKAKREELEFFRKKGVLKVVPRIRAAGRRVIGTRWVSCNKGDKAHPDIRCRVVSQEVKTYQSEEFYAATPPLEALRLIVSLAADEPELEVSLVDISRAYF